MNALTKLLVVGVSFFSFRPTLLQADWPVVRGDALASGVAKSELPAELDVLWNYTLESGGFEATAVIADGKVFVGDFEGTFHALNLADGERLWKRTFEDSGFTQAAAYANGRIVVGDYNGIIRCLDAKSGEVLWTCGEDAEANAEGDEQKDEQPLTIAEKEQAALESEFISESYAAPNIHEGQVLVTTEAGQLLALDLATGKRLWIFRIEAPLRCWPTVVEGKVLLAGCDQRFHAVDIASGDEASGVDIDAQTGSTPAVLDGKVLFGTEQGSFYSINAETMKVHWRHHDPKQGQPIRASAAVDRRCVIFPNQGKQVTALNPQDGEPLWTFPVRSRVESSPVIAGELVFLPTKRGRLYAVDVASGEQRWQYEAGGAFLASPAVSDGKLVLGNEDGTLYCFGKKIAADER